MQPSPRDNAALVRQFLTEVVAGGDTDALDVFLDEGARHRCVTPTGSAPDAGTADPILVLSAADVDVEVDRLVAQDDRVALRGTLAGVYRSSFVDPVASGASFEVPFAWFCRVEDGSIVAIWSLPATAELRRQLGSTGDHGQAYEPEHR